MSKMIFLPGHRLILWSLTKTYVYPTRTASWVSRQPKRVLTDNGMDYSEVELGLPPDPETRVKRSGSKKNVRPKVAKKKIEITRTKTNYRFIDTVISITSKSRMRNKHELVLLEGIRLIQDCFSAGAKFETIYYSDEHNLKDFPEIIEMAGNVIPVVRVDQEDYKLVSKQVTPSGFMGICFKPTDEQLIRVQENSTQKLLPLTVIASSFTDPGNLGTLVRSTAAVGASRLICSGGCVHVWDPKVMRAGAGSHFRLPISHDLDWDTIHNELVAKNARLYYAETSNKSPFFHDVNFSEKTVHSPLALLIGSETRGFHPEARDLIEKMNGQILSIPVANGVESLNNHVTAAVIMYEMRRQLIQ